MPISLRPGFILLIGVLAMSSAAILIRLCLDANISPHAIAAYRLTIASMILAIPALRQQAIQDYAKLGYGVLSTIVLSGLLLALHFGAWITSLAYTSIVSSVFLVASTPLWIGLLSPLLLKEHLRRSIWVGIGVTILGSVIIGMGNTSTNQPLAWQGNGLALIGAMCAALYLIIGRSLSMTLPLSSYIWAVYSVAALILIFWAISANVQLIGYPLEVIVWLLMLGIIPQLIGHSSANYAIRHLSPSIVSLAILGEPVGTSMLSILFLHEWPTFNQIVGGSIILLGIAIPVITELWTTKHNLALPSKH